MERRQSSSLDNETASVRRGHGNRVEVGLSVNFVGKILKLGLGNWESKLLHYLLLHVASLLYVKCILIVVHGWSKQRRLYSRKVLFGRYKIVISVLLVLHLVYYLIPVTASLHKTSQW